MSIALTTEDEDNSFNEAHSHLIQSYCKQNDAIPGGRRKVLLFNSVFIAVDPELTVLRQHTSIH